MSRESRNYFVDLLLIAFGLSSWIEINGLWVQTPLLVQRLPEGWKLASYIVVISQLGNIGPLFYSFLKFAVKRKLERISIHSTLFIGTLSCILLALFWNKTAVIFGKEHSLVLLIFTGLLAVVDCTTSVLYFPFMVNQKSQYFISLLIGEGCSGLIASLVSLIQGIGDAPTCVNQTEKINGSEIIVLKPEYPSPRFSISAFFVIMSVMMVISWVAFFILSVIKNGRAENNSENSSVNVDGYETIEDDLNKFQLVLLISMQTYICCLTNGVLPAIQTFSTLPYGSLTFHFAVNLSVIANPVACFVAYFTNKCTAHKALITFAGSLFAGYVLVTSILSPKPLLRNSIGSSVVVLSWVLCIGLFSYSKAAIAAVLRNHLNSERNLFWYGVFTQVGSTVGAIVAFILVNFTKLFTAVDPCA